MRISDWSSDVCSSDLFGYVSRKSERKNTSALAVENLNPNIDICHRIKRFVVKPQSCTFTRLKGSHYSPRRDDLFNPSNSQLTGTIPSVGWRQFEFSARNNFIEGGRTELEIEFQSLARIVHSNFFALVQNQTFI